MSDRIDNLERSLLDLGTEIYRLKHSLSFAASQNDKLNKAIQSLKETLIGKGLVSPEEFEDALDTSDPSLDLVKTAKDYETFSGEGLKKKSH